MKENTLSAVHFPSQSRVHIGLAVGDLQRSRDFYRVLLGQEPTKERPGYVKFETVEPALNLSLNESSSAISRPQPGHYGIQVQSSQAVAAALERFEQAGLVTRIEEATSCCYSVQDKVWVEDPDGNQWEVFVVTQAEADRRADADSSCCVSSKSRESACCAPA